MLKQATSASTAVAEATTELWAFFRGGFVPLREANVSVMTHALNYGTAVFEGIRAYWNADAKQLYALDLVPHFQRIVRSARLLYMEVPYGPEEMADFAVELLRRDGLQEDVY
ncbi:MAG: branched chain amino acid aminotransferase, partial [Candidatus Limnocylindria bacterium]